MKIFVHGIGVLGPNFANWQECQNRLKPDSQIPESFTQIPDPMPSILPMNERRRSSGVVRWALQVAQEAVRQSNMSSKEMATVFASSGGETEILHKICHSLTFSPPMVSPTLFHQSVHNAAVGYWSIASGSQRPSTSLSCYDASFSGGLLESATLLSTHQEEYVLFVACDIAAPFPLNEARPLAAPFAVAMVLSHHAPPKSLSKLTITLLSEPLETSPTTMSHTSLEQLRSGSPAARSLPLLHAMANHLTTSVYLNFLDNLQLQIAHQPCPPCRE